MPTKRIARPFRPILIKTTLALVALLAVGGLGWFTARSATLKAEERRRGQAFENLTANVIERIAELSVLEYRYTDVMELQRKFLIGGQSASLVRFSGSVKAGIADVSSVKAAYDPVTGEVNVTVPRCAIISNDVDIGSVRIWDLKRNLFVPISTEFKIQEVSAFRAKVENELAATGFLDEADARAAEIIGSLYAGFGSKINVNKVR